MPVIGFADYRVPARALAEALNQPYHEVEVHRFPDGESRIRLDAPPGQEVIVCRSLDRPNDKLIELLLLHRHLRKLGVERITLVAPYLCYMRQDKAFRPGEVVSQPIIAEFIGQQVEQLLTVDPHLHRVHSLEQAFPQIRSRQLSASSVIANYLGTLPGPCLLLGPDQESQQWVSAIAQTTGWDFRVAQKLREGDTTVQIELPEYDYRGQQVMLVDDVISTGHTLAKISRQLHHHGVKSVACVVTHPLFSEGALDTLKAAGITDIHSTDTIVHPSNRVSMVTEIAKALMQ